MENTINENGPDFILENITKGEWNVNHWSTSKSGLQCININKDGISYYSGDAVTGNFYGIRSKIEPSEYPIQGSFEGAHIADLVDFIHQDGGKQSKANALLIADAGTTSNKCGKLPSYLLAQNIELERQLETGANQYAKVFADNGSLLEAVTLLYERYVKHGGHPDMQDKIKSLIEKSKDYV